MNEASPSAGETIVTTTGDTSTSSTTVLGEEKSRQRSSPCGLKACRRTSLLT